jgi:DNA invertase Pin-like site-specific DNA recombinase
MPSGSHLWAGIYARVSTGEQDTAGQLEALRRYAAARGWEAVEYVDHGVSGAKERRPALHAVIFAVRRREVGLVVITKLDRLALSLSSTGGAWTRI